MARLSNRSFISINGEEESEKDCLLRSPRCERTGRSSATVPYDTAPPTYVLNFKSNGKRDAVSRHWGTRGEGGEGKPGSSRARVMLYLVMVFHTFSNLTGTIDTQYYHSRFHSMYFNGSVSRPTVSKCITNASDPEKVGDNEAQRAQSQFQELMSYTTLGPLLLAVIFFGSMSDVMGRRFLIIMPLVVTSCTHTLMIFIIRFDLDLRILYVRSVVDGCTGSGFVLSIGLYSYLADTTPPNQARTLSMTVLSFSDTVSSIVGNLVIGHLLKHYPYLTVYFIPFSVKIVTVFLAWFFLPETLPQKAGKKRSGCFNPLRYVVNVFSVFLCPENGRKRLLMCLCMLILLLHYVITTKHGSVFTLYELGQPFCWDPEQLSYYTAASGGLKSTVALLSLTVLQRIFPDPPIMVLGFLSTLGQFVMEGIARNTAMLYLAFVAGMITSLATTINKSLLSNMAGKDKQGALFASIAVIETVSEFASNALLNSVYQATVTTFPGAVFLVMAALTVPVIFLTLVYVLLSRSKEATFKPTVQCKVPTDTKESSV